MAPRTVGELASLMAHGGNIHHENYEFTGVRGLAPTYAYSRGPNLYHGDPEHVAHSGHTLRTASDGSILEFTYLEGPEPLLTAGRG